MKTVSYLLISFLAVAVYAHASANECAHGPGYWCSSPDAAELCGAVDFCRQLSERSKSRPRDSRSVAAANRGANNHYMCSKCLQVMVIIRQAALVENKTPAQIEQLVKTEVCPQLRFQEDACDAMTQLFLPELVQTTGMDIQTDLICTFLGMCDQPSGRVGSRRYKTVTAASSLRAQSQTSHRETGARLKSAPPPFERHPVLMLMHLQKLPRTGRPLSKMPSCGLCRALVDGARRLPFDDSSKLEAARTDAQTLMTTACQLEGAPAHCMAAMSSNAEVILQLISSDLESDIVCQTLGTCSSGSSSSLPDPESEVTALLASQIDAVVSGPRCLLCRMVVSATLSKLGPIKSLVAIEAMLKRSCSTLSPVLKRQCGRFVDKYSRRIAQLIVKGRGANFICAKLSLCSGEASVMPPPPPQLPLPQSQLDEDEGRRMHAVVANYDANIDLM